MNIAVVTGASSGMGREFVYALDKEKKYEEIWVIARRAERLEALKSETETPVIPLALDLTDAESIAKYRALLEEKGPMYACSSTAPDSENSAHMRKSIQKLPRI